MNLSQAITILMVLVAINIFYNYSANQRSLDQQHTNSQKSEKPSGNKPLQPGVKYFGTAIFLFPMLAGLWGINYWFNDYNLAKETLNWNKYNGILISKDIQGEVRKNHSRDVRATGTTYYSPEVVYQFTVDGRKYQGKNIDYNSHPSYGDENKVTEYLQGLPETGEDILVYVNDDISKSVIKPGTQNMSYFGLLASLPFFLIGLIGLKFIYKF